MRCIRQIHLDDYGTTNEHITHVRSSTSTGGVLERQTREDVVRRIDLGLESYHSHNDATRGEAAVRVRVSKRGTRYIATVADGRETNNLLSLPRF